MRIGPFGKLYEMVSDFSRIVCFTFSKEEIQTPKKHMKKMLTIPGHKGNANQNHIKIPPHPLEWLPSKLQTTSIGEDAGWEWGGKEPSYTAGRNVT
jgi:hypothetical protein